MDMRKGCEIGRLLTNLTQLTRTAPGRSQGGAALGLESVPVDVDLAAAILDVQPTGPLQTVCGEKNQLTDSLN